MINHPLIAESIFSYLPFPFFQQIEEIAFFILNTRSVILSLVALEDTGHHVLRWQCTKV